MKQKLYLCLFYLLFIGMCQACSFEPSLTEAPVATPSADPLPLPSPIVLPNDELQISPAPTGDYLVNPGIGWQAGPGNADNINIPETVAYSSRREIAWKILNPDEGVYDWENLDAQLSKATQAGKQFSFRVYSMVGMPFDGHMVPDWVLAKGAVITPSGEPDYSNCIYQEEWGKFVEQIVRRYDGNPDIAFIDISGYGNFNEWSWQDSQTEWDSMWENNFLMGTAVPQDFQTLDGQARRRLVDIYIGGAFELHSCRMLDGSVKEVSYSYAGFQKTQLVMPYAGIAQSTQYVASRRKDIGFRFDCLGNYSEDVFQKVGREIGQIWKTAPVVYELCKPNEVDLDSAKWLLQNTHGSLVHNNASEETLNDLEDLVRNAGYRYFLKEARLQILKGNLHLQMEWQNTGLAPNYPKMGQNFELLMYLVDEETSSVVFDTRILADIATWLPSVDAEATTYVPVSHKIDQTIHFPETVDSGTYLVKVAIVNLRTNQPVILAVEGSDVDGKYLLGKITLE